LNYLDIFIASLLVFGFVRGYSKGLVMELSSVLALILGVYGSIKFSDFTFIFFSKNFPELIKDIDENYLKIASFVFTFLFIIVLISIVGKGVTKILKMVFLGFINKILGGCFGSLKFTLFISLFLVFFDSLNSSFNLVESSVLETSYFYDPIKEVGNKLIEFFNSNKESINFFN
tara:strand:- start:111 stop:632 length:522 start_codon:yes stop_codon:yes gene_type:complete